MGVAIVQLVNAIFQLMVIFIIASAILSWLVAFDVLNIRNRFVGNVAYFLERVTYPVLEPFRRIIPTLGGIDISPIAALLALQFLQTLFNRMLAPGLIMGLG